ncbi:MAG: aldehyde dehydrogenase family protein [Pseudomonadota bacterium]
MSFSIKGSYFNGDFQQPATGGLNRSTQYIEKFCPASLETRLWNCLIDNQHIEAVTESATNGFIQWHKTTIEKRVQYIKAYAEQLEANRSAIAEAVSLETGRPLWDTMDELSTALQHIPLLILLAQKKLAPNHLESVQFHPLQTQEIEGLLEYRSLGPCLIIASSCLPVLLISNQMINALLAGNSIILKPSEKTCYTAQLLFECFHRSGLPANVVNLIHGDHETARRLLKEKSIHGVFFTGGRDNGERIMDLAQGDLNKQLTLALGCKNLSIIHSDANSPQVRTDLIKAAFISSGQRCTCTSIVAIHRSIQDEFIGQFHALAKELVIDHPLDFEKEPFMGPVIDKASKDNYLLFIGMAKREGMEEIMRGKEIQKKSRGHYITPSIHFTAQFNPKSMFLTNELYGPNCIFMSYENISDVVELINGSPFGQTTSLYTQDRDVIQYCHQEIAIGRLNINVSTLAMTPQMPFQAVRSSANYRPAGFCTIDSFLRPFTSLKAK